jgi:WD40 repeat protein
MEHQRLEPAETFPQYLFNPPDEVNALLFSPDGSLLVSAGRDGQVRLWQLPGGRLLTALLPANLRETVRYHEESHLYPPVLALAFAPDATRLYAGDIYGQVHVYAIPGTP